jgi:hypothetical protein
MEIQFYYVFSPTSHLIEIAKVAGQEYLAHVAVWIDKSNDRLGKEHSQEDVVAGFWDLFLANLIEDHPEPQNLLDMRQACLNLGFSKCWNIVCTKKGGETAELLAEAVRARSFLQGRGILESRTKR